jgi:hypothetical protein
LHRREPAQGERETHTGDHTEPPTPAIAERDHHGDAPDEDGTANRPNVFDACSRPSCDTHHAIRAALSSFGFSKRN